MSNIFNTSSKNKTAIRVSTSITDEVAQINTAVVDSSIITNNIYADKVYTYDSYGDMVHLTAGTGIPSNLYISKLVVDPNELTTTDMFSTIDEHGITVASASGSTIIGSSSIKITNSINETFSLDNSSIQFLDSFNQIAEILPGQINFNSDVSSDISSINTNHDKLLLIEGITNDQTDDISDLQNRLYGSGKSVVLGDGQQTKISASGYFSAFSNSKNILSCSGAGVYIDMEPIARTLTLNNSVMIGKGNSSFNDSSDNACFGINNIVPRTSVIMGLDNIANRGGPDTRYSVIVGSNNQINNRCFIFGRDNNNIGERTGGFTTPSFCLGSGNNYLSPKDPCMILGFDTNDVGVHPDSLSGCIVVGGGQRIYEPYCAYYGNGLTQKTFMAGIRGTGNILSIDNGTTEIIKNKDIVLYNDTNTDSKVISYDSYAKINNINKYRRYVENQGFTNTTWTAINDNVQNFEFIYDAASSIVNSDKVINFCVKRINDQFNPLFKVQILKYTNETKRYLGLVKVDYIGLETSTNGNMYYQYKIVFPYLGGTVDSLNGCTLLLSRYDYDTLGTPSEIPF